MTEERTKEYLERLKLLHKLIKKKVEEEKQKRTDTLNIRRVKDIQIPNEPYIRTTFHKKNKPKYFRVLYDQTKRLATNPKMKRKAHLNYIPTA